MMDREQRHRRRMLGWVLLGTAALLLVAVGMVWSLFGRLALGQVNYSYALLVAMVMVFLALAGTGAYLVRRMRGE